MPFPGVRLAAAPRGGVVFAALVTIVGTASLRDVAQRTGHVSLVEEAARFRATLVVETDEPWVEESWLGAEVAVGDATLRIGGPTPRCAVIDHHPQTGIRDTRFSRYWRSSGRPTVPASRCSGCMPRWWTPETF